MPAVLYHCYLSAEAYHTEMGLRLLLITLALSNLWFSSYWDSNSTPMPVSAAEHSMSEHHDCCDEDDVLDEQCMSHCYQVTFYTVVKKESLPKSFAAVERNSVERFMVPSFITDLPYKPPIV